MPRSLSLVGSFCVQASAAVAQIEPIEPDGPNAPIPQAEVTVYRDLHGVPHFVAPSERSAWYALGYEQARDGLLWIQFACKAAKGELTWVLGTDGLENDLAVKILGAHLGGRTTAELQAMFSPANPAITANFYQNCVAFADGANSYRLVVKYAPATPSTPERQLHDWLDGNSLLGGQVNLAWVYEDEILPVDIASQGAWTAAYWSVFRAQISVVNSSDGSYALVGGSGEDVDPGLDVGPLSAGAGTRLLEEMRQHASAVPGAPSAMSGSNSFAWAHMHCSDPSTNPATTYAGLLADPHQGLPFFWPFFTLQFRAIPNHLWFAHVQVTPPGASQPTLDVFGHVPYAAAAFFSHHNRSVAIGGTAGAPNHTDHFVLRLREDPQTGDPANPHEFYSYYHDTVPGSNTTYQPVDPETVAITIRRPSGNVVTVNVPYWRVQSFGFVLPDLGQAKEFVAGTGSIPLMPVVYGERVDPTQPAPPRWRVQARNDDPNNPPPPKMRYWRLPQRDASNFLITSPMVVTLRCPMDSEVAGNPMVPGENRHWLLLRDFWEISHAASIWDVIPRTNGALYPVNLCAVDRDGRTLSTQLAAVPKRGDDGALQSAQPPYTSLDKYLFYSGAAGPVPARHYKDRMFDWRFGTQGTPARPAPLEYLEYPTSFSQPFPTTSPFKPITLQEPGPPGSAFPPTNYSGSGIGFRIESGFFASACNDQIWGYSRKRDATSWLTPAPLGNDVDTDNWLLRKVLDAGCAYQSSIVSFEAPDHRQQIVVDRFTQQALRIVQGAPAGLPPLTPAELRQFVVTPRLYHEATYVPPTGVTANASLPTPVRQLKEVVDNPLFDNGNPLGYVASPLVRARRELEFFRDFWTHLSDPQWPWNSHVAQPGVTVNLRDLWVNGSAVNQVNQNQITDQIFWYDNPTNTASLRWIDLPADFPLIDFVWTDSDLGSGFTTGNAATPSTPAALSTGEENTLTSLANALVIWDVNVAPADRYRNVPAATGGCLLEMLRMGYNASGNFARKWRRLVRGVPDAGLKEKEWATLQGLAFPDGQLETLFKGGLNPPYDALYVNGQGVPVKATLTPADTNKLVQFFLQLGGHYIRPQDNGNNPSRKLARWGLANHDAGRFLSYLPGNYPLTGGLERVTVLRRLLDTYTFLNSSTPAMSQYFKTRAYDHYGLKLWPPAGAPDADCVGAALRSVVWYEEPPGTPGLVPGKGFQQKFLGMSGSYATLLALFPKQGTSQGSVESFFWCTPGVQAMGADPLNPGTAPMRFNLHMGAYATNSLMRSYYSSFSTLGNYASVIWHSYAF